jgi:hypothetical protein
MCSVPDVISTRRVAACVMGVVGWLGLFVLVSPVAGAAATLGRSGAAMGPASTGAQPMVLTPEIPAAPTDVTAVAGDGQVTASWTAPTDDGGSPITGYRVSGLQEARSPDSIGCATTGATTCVVTGLIDNYSYTFIVQTINAVGPGADSDNSPAVVPAAGSLYHPITPTRILDSRPATQVGPDSTPWGQAESRAVTVAGVAGVPSDATAVALNVTVTDTTASGFLTAWPAGTPRPLASSLNWTAGETIPNAATVGVGSGQAVDVFNSAGHTDVVIDAVGYYEGAGDANGSGFEPDGTVRVLDSRPATQVGGESTPWGPGQTRSEYLGNAGYIQSSTTAVALNVTVTDTTSAGYLTVWPTGQPRPLASSLNWTAGQTVANSVTVPLGTGEQISIYNPTGQTDVVVDVVGAFDIGAGGGALHPTAPTRVLDSRAGSQVGPFDSPWTHLEEREVQVAGLDSIPSGTGVAAVVANLTVTDTTAASYLTVNASGLGGTSNINWTSGEVVANQALLGVPSPGNVIAYNFAGSVDVVIDVNAWYD